MATFAFVRTPTTLSNLAREIHLDIIARLPYDAKASLRSTNRYFYSIILPFSHDDLLVAEGEEYAAARDLLACKYCLYLHHKSEFGDNMTKKKKARRVEEAATVITGSMLDVASIHHKVVRDTVMGNAYNGVVRRLRSCSVYGAGKWSSRRMM
jgi:hypothetical protein